MEKRNARRLAGVAVLVCLLAGACSHFDPYEHMNEPQPPAGTPRDPRLVLPTFVRPDLVTANDPVFVGTLPAALQEVDATRLALMKTLASMGRERAAYDASLWTLTPYAVWKALSAGPGSVDAQRQVGGIAAVLGGWAAFLGSRPKEFEASYAQTVDRLTCTMARGGKDLFRRSEYGASEMPPARRLEIARRNYESAASEVTDAIRDSPLPDVANATCAIEGSAECRERRVLLNKGGGNFNAELTDAKAVIKRNQDVIAAFMRPIKELDGRVEWDAANEVRSRLATYMSQLEAKLRENRPALVTFQNASKTLSAKAQSDGRFNYARDAASIESIQATRWLSTGTRQDRLERAHLVRALRWQEGNLRAVLADAADLLQSQDDKSANASALADALGCEPDILPIASTPGAPVPRVTGLRVKTP